jgi:hypothetical protein
VYRSDNPLKNDQPCATEAGACSNDAYDNQPWGYDVANFHRVVVHGSTFPLEWLRLSDVPGRWHDTTSTSFGPFSWSRQIQP